MEKIVSLQRVLQCLVIQEIFNSFKNYIKFYFLMQLISKINEKMRLRFINVQIGLENRFDMVQKKIACFKKFGYLYRRRSNYVNSINEY